MLKQLKTFMAVVDCHSFTEAAEQCFISQSAISQQISALENDLGVALLKRENRKFSLTPAGEYLYRHGRSFLQQAEQLRAETIRIGQDSLPPLRIGYLEGYSGRELQDTIIEFTERHPHVHLSVAKFTHEELFSRVSQNELELVFSYQRRAFSDAYVNLHLRYIPCMIEISAKNPLAKSDHVTPRQLHALTCVLVARNEQQEIEQDFYQKTLGIGSSFHFVDSLDDARLAILSGRSFLPVADIRASSEVSEGIKRLPIYQNQKPIQFNYCAFWKKENSNPYIEDFVSIFRNKL